MESVVAQVRRTKVYTILLDERGRVISTVVSTKGSDETKPFIPTDVEADSHKAFAKN
jgi:hypothetical protein